VGRRAVSSATTLKILNGVGYTASGTVYAVFNDASEGAALYRLDREKLQWKPVGHPAAGSLLGTEGPALAFHAGPSGGLMWLTP